MKIKEITSEHGNDFSAIMVCEHCSYEHKITYHDNYYHTKVVPGMFCPKCKLNREGVTMPPTPAPD